MRLLRLLCSSLVFAASVSASNASQPHSGQLEAGQEILLPLAVKTGDYIEASLDTPQARVNLDLLASDGHAVRRLLQASIGSGVFRFIAQPGQTLRLGGTVSTTPYTLRITRQVSVAEQKLPPEPLASPALRELAADLTKGGSTDAFWARMAHEGTPLIEAAGNGQYRVTFLWRGAKHGVRLFGGPARDHDELQRLGQSDVWFRSYTVPANARASYRLAPDVPVFAGNPRERRVAILATAQADPLNPRRWPGDAPDRFTQQSVLELPEAPLQAWITPTGAASGSLQSWLQESRILGNTHDIALYRPAGFDPGNPANLLLFVFDGPEYQSRVPTPTILDNLVAAGRLPPTVAVFISNASAEARSVELPDNPDFARFMAEELLPRVARETGMQPRGERTTLAGSSYGGLASASIALRYPQQFGNVIALSGSFWWAPLEADQTRHYIGQRVLTLPKAPLRFFVSAGLYETANGTSGGILESSRHLRDLLEARAYPVHFREYTGGHDYLVWRGALADGLLALFDLKPSQVTGLLSSPTSSR